MHPKELLSSSAGLPPPILLAGSVQKGGGEYSQTLVLFVCFYFSCNAFFCCVREQVLCFCFAFLWKRLRCTGFTPNCPVSPFLCICCIFSERSALWSLCKPTLGFASVQSLNYREFWVNLLFWQAFSQIYRAGINWAFLELRRSYLLPYCGT